MYYILVVHVVCLIIYILQLINLPVDFRSKMAPEMFLLLSCLLFPIRSTSINCSGAYSMISGCSLKQKVGCTFYNVDTDTGEMGLPVTDGTVPDNVGGGVAQCCQEVCTCFRIKARAFVKEDCSPHCNITVKGNETMFCANVITYPENTSLEMAQTLPSCRWTFGPQATSSQKNYGPLNGCTVYETQMLLSINSSLVPFGRYGRCINITASNYTLLDGIMVTFELSQLTTTLFSCSSSNASYRMVVSPDIPPSSPSPLQTNNLIVEIYAPIIGVISLLILVFVVVVISCCIYRHGKFQKSDHSVTVHESQNAYIRHMSGSGTDPLLIAEPKSEDPILSLAAYPNQWSDAAGAMEEDTLVKEQDKNVPSEIPRHQVEDTVKTNPVSVSASDFEGGLVETGERSVMFSSDNPLVSTFDFGDTLGTPREV